MKKIFDANNNGTTQTTKNTTNEERSVKGVRSYFRALPKEGSQNKVTTAR
jgi:hypothetical protein